MPVSRAADSSMGMRVSTVQRNTALMLSRRSTSSVQITSTVTGTRCMRYTRVFRECITRWLGEDVAAR